MNQEEIKEILPHRDNMLLVDEVVQDGEEAIGTYHVRGDEFSCRDISLAILWCRV